MWRYDGWAGLMRIVRFGAPGEEVPGCLVEGGVVPLDGLTGDAPVEWLIGSWAELERDLAAFIAATPPMPLQGLRLGPPLGSPPKIVGVGANYCAADGTPPGGPIDPILFFKPASSLVGPTDAIVLPFEASSVVGEVELGIVIGRRGHRVSPAAAMDHVFGYAIANDLTAPEVMLGDSAQSPLFFQQGRGKGFPTFCPLGPWIVTADAMPLPAECHLEQEVDGQVELSGRASLMHHSIATLVSEVSHAFGLEPGDVILSGSPRPAPGKRRQPLVAGNLLVSRISGLGELRNRVVAEEDRWPGQPLRRWNPGGQGRRY